MFKNTIKIAFRTIKKHKGYSFVNLAGLAIGMVCCILILLWVQDELSYDKFHDRGHEIYRVAKEEHRTEEIQRSRLTPPPLASALKEDFPEILKSTRFGSWERRLIKYGEKSFNERGYYHVDPDFFEMFSFPFVKGDSKTAFSNPYSIVITEAMAEKYFGEEDPMGKTLNVNHQFDVTITGVIKNVPHNSSLQFDFLSPFRILLTEFIGENNGANWGFNSFSTYVLIPQNSAFNELNQKLFNYLQKRDPDDRDHLFIQPLGHLHLNSHLEYDIDGRGDIKYVWIFTLLAFFILFIACINFMNLTTARAAKRAREVGLRKVVGARRLQLIKQFFGEAVLMAFIALLLAGVLVEILIPQFNELTGKQLSLHFTGNLTIYIGSMLIVIITGIIAGSYPALFLSSFRPAKVLKDSLKVGGASSLFRTGLVIIQFSLSVFLIIGTVIISKQLSFMRNRDLGFNREQVVHMRLHGEELTLKYGSIKNEFLRIPGVVSVTASMALPTDIRSSPGSPEWEGKDPSNNMQIKADFVDYDYIETFNIEMAEGRSFSRSFAMDDSASYMVNQEAVRQMGLESPVGKRFSFWGIQGQIIGVMKDFHFQPLHNEIKPIVFKIFPAWFRRMYVKLRPEHISETIDSLEKTWKLLNPGYPFEYRFLDEDFDDLYGVERRLGILFNYFTFLAIFIACLGLFGLTSFMAEQRTKEIGIRKVLGATVSGIVLLLSKEFTKWVLVANMIAWPVAYFVMDKWLQGFAYRTNIGVFVFFLACFLSLMMVMITVSYQAVRAAIANPIRALKYE